MQVDFSFDETLIETDGHTLAQVYNAIKREFSKRKIACISDGELLSFEGGTNKDDFSNMWIVIYGLTKLDWFMKYATSCIWRPNEYRWEDVLRRAKEVYNEKN